MTLPSPTIRFRGVLVAGLLCSITVSAWSQLPDQPLRNAAKQIASETPKRGDVTAIAVLPLDGDKDDRAHAALTAALVRAGTYDVVSRKPSVIEELMKELDINDNDDIFDPEKAQEFGKRVGAGALLIGEVRQLRSGYLHVQLVHTETAIVILSGPYIGHFWMWFAQRAGIWLAIGIGLIVAYGPVSNSWRDKLFAKPIAMVFAVVFLGMGWILVGETLLGLAQ